MGTLPQVSHALGISVQLVTDARTSPVWCWAELWALFKGKQGLLKGSVAEVSQLSSISPAEGMEHVEKTSMSVGLVHGWGRKAG